MKSKSQILQMIEKFLKGAAEPTIQQALNQMGMGPDQISGLAQTLDLFSNKDLEIQRVLSNKKVATRQKNEARAHVCALVSNLARIIKLIQPNSSYLSALQMETRYKTVTSGLSEGNTEGQGQTAMRRAVSQAKSDGELRVYLSGVLANLPGMPEALKKEVALFGWGDAANQQLVDAVHSFNEAYEVRERLKRDYHQKVSDNQKVWRRLIQLFRAYNGNVKCQMKAFPEIVAKLKWMTGTLNSAPPKPPKSKESTPVAAQAKDTGLKGEMPASIKVEEAARQDEKGELRGLGPRAFQHNSRNTLGPVYTLPMGKRKRKFGLRSGQTGLPPGRGRLG